ncbi:MAG: PKD domain-containing protein [Flavobacteriales bacterium]|nr:PKD domain-containing protein [Flavobacteriales bacterium]
MSGNIANFQNTMVVSGAMTYTWNFGDGIEGYGPNPAHTYSEPGTYTACLLVWAWNPLTQDTCFADHCELVTIEGTASPCDELEAGFIWTTTPNGTQFSNGTSGTGFSTTWHWTFGDGATSNDAQPFHTYVEPGEYEVCLYAVSIYELSGGNVITCTDSSCAIVVIGGGDPCADFEACFVTNDFGNGTYFFDNCSSNQGNGQFYWTFGDGSTSTLVNAEHHYAQPGTYTVCLYAYYLNCADTTCSTIVVQGSSVPCDALEAGFTWTTTPNGTQFSNTTSGTGFSSTWHWTFGDGTTSNNGQPFHTYAQPGAYEVCLYVTSIYELSGGNVITCTDTVCGVVIIQNGGDPCDDLNACFETVVIDDNSFVFVNCSAPTTNIQYLWAFGDGTTVGGVNADHSYQQPGTYTVCLTAYWGNCVDSTCTTIVVGGGGGCQPFEVDFGYGVQGTAVVFEATASVPVLGVLWYFGDGGEGYGPVVTHLYEPPGPFNVCVAAWYWNDATQDTCWAEHCEWVDPFQNGVGISEDLDDAIRVYPNPARGVISIDGLSSSGDVLIHSPEGRVVLQQRTHATRHVMSVEHLAPAIYSLELRTAQGSLWRRIAIE